MRLSGTLTTTVIATTTTATSLDKISQGAFIEISRGSLAFITFNSTLPLKTNTMTLSQMRSTVEKVRGFGLRIDRRWNGVRSERRGNGVRSKKRRKNGVRSEATS